MTGLERLDGFGGLDPGWSAALEPEIERLNDLARFLDAETTAGRGFLPAAANVLRAFRSPFEKVKVIIVGQDPYPTPGHSIGLCFATDRHVHPLPRSLANIYRELRDDLGIDVPVHGDLSAWANEGVLLLNRVLTVQPGLSGSHRGHGWEAVTELAVRALVARDQPLAAILWGKDAGALKPALGPTPIIESVHPSPLSASRGFFGSRPFSRTNDLLEQLGTRPVDWSLPA